MNRCGSLMSVALLAMVAWSNTAHAADPAAFLAAQTIHCPGCDLRGVSLARRDLSGADLTGANLTGADLSRAILRGTNLRAPISPAQISSGTTLPAPISPAPI